MTAPVLISGAGLGGLLLARSLRNSRIPFKLYERDSSIASRGQGYRIRISEQGITALRDVLTPEQTEKFLAGTSKTGGGGIHSFDAITGDKMDDGPKPGQGGGGSRLGGDVLGVARGFLRKCLFEGMEDVVHFGKQTVSYELVDSGVKLHFKDGTSSPVGSLVVACEGANSPLTRQLTDGRVKALDTGARMIHGQTPGSVFEALGEGVFFVRDNTHEAGPLGLITNVRPGTKPTDEVGWVFVAGPGIMRAPNDDFSATGKVAADLSRELSAKWSDKLRPILEQQVDAEAAFLKMSTGDPDGIPEWKNEPRVTLLGDSVHCMTPAGGVGANTALADAALIGKLLHEAGGWKEGLTEAYEKEMRVYGSENVKMSFEAAAKQFGITELKR